MITQQSAIQPFVQLLCVNRPVVPTVPLLCVQDQCECSERYRRVILGSSKYKDDVCQFTQTTNQIRQHIIYNVYITYLYCKT